MDILSEIMAAKRRRLATAMAEMPIAKLREAAIEARRFAQRHALSLALANSGRVNIIAEFKRRSPSKGTIRDGVTAAEVSAEYERGGAAAISVLTEEDYFAGSLADLRAVRDVVSLPILRKDFVFDTYQVYESAAAGAAALLLIVAALNDDELKSLRQLSEEELGMDALVEVHTSAELKRAIAAGARLVGINNRDLKTFAVSLDTSLQLAREAPANTVLISESGLNNSADLRQLAATGFKGFLIGESLMRANAPRAALQTLIAGAANVAEIKSR